MHELKTASEMFQAIKRGDKRFEIRARDRDFRVGDTLWLREYDGTNYTGDNLFAKVPFIVYGPQWGLPQALCVMSIVVTDYRWTPGAGEARVQGSKAMSEPSNNDASNMLHLQAEIDRLRALVREMADHMTVAADVCISEGILVDEEAEDERAYIARCRARAGASSEP